jgi:hypothetical protein
MIPERGLIVDSCLCFSIVTVILITIVLPNKIGMLAKLFARQKRQHQSKIRLQTFFRRNVDILHARRQSAQKENQDVEKYFRTVWARTIPTEVSPTSMSAIRRSLTQHPRLALPIGVSKKKISPHKEFFLISFLKRISTHRRPRMAQQPLTIFKGIASLHGTPLFRKILEQCYRFGNMAAQPTNCAVGIRG